jgi:hypothetical protein
MRRKYLRLLLIIAAVIGTVCILPVALLIMFFGDFPERLSVEDEALQLAQEALATIGQSSTVTPASYIATYSPDCYAFSRERLKSNNYQYILKVTAAFDPNDARFASYVKYSNGSRDAEVAVRFPDGGEVRLYFYAAHWEGCTVIQTPATPT